MVELQTYHIRYEPRPLDTSRFDGLEEVNHSLSFQSLQLGMDTDECPSTTNTITTCEVVCVCVHTFDIANLTDRSS